MYTLFIMIHLKIILHSDELYRFVAVLYGKNVLPAEVSELKKLIVDCQNICLINVW